MDEIKDCIRRYFKQHFKSWVLSIILFMLTALLAMLPAKLLQLIIDEAFLKYNISILLKLCFILAVVHIAKAVSTYISNKYLIELGNGLLKQIKSRIYSKLYTMDMKFYTKSEVGYINSRIEEINSIDALFSNQTLVLFSSMLEFIFALVILFSINTKVLAVLSIPIPFLIILVIRTSRLLSQCIQDSMDSTAEYSGKLNESLHGIENVKSQGYEEIENEKINTLNDSALGNQKKQSDMINIFSSSMGTVGSLITLIVYLIGGIFFIRRDLTMGSFFAVSSYAGKLYSPILSYASISIILQPAYLSLKRVVNFFFDNQREKQDIGTEEIDDITSIEFKDVHFSYDEIHDLYPDGISLQVEKGERLHIIGKNGTGKSTIFRLLLKLYNPQSGTIIINGIHLKKITRKSIVQNISYVSQKGFVFNDSLISNITYGMREYDRERLDYIMRKLNLNELNERLNREYGGMIGEMGSHLSGGEIQKIALARAMLLNRSVYLLDEATSHLDSNSIAFLLDYINHSNAIWIVIDHQTNLSEYGFKKVNLNKRKEDFNG